MFDGHRTASSVRILRCCVVVNRIHASSAGLWASDFASLVGVTIVLQVAVIGLAFSDARVAFLRGPPFPVGELSVACRLLPVFAAAFESTSPPWLPSRSCSTISLFREP
eukprot:1185784-Prorocentrum_minimum.AAC.3